MATDTVEAAYNVLDILAFTYLHQFGFPVNVNQMLKEGETYLGGCPPFKVIGVHGVDS